MFGDALVAEAERDERVIGITAAMNSGTGLDILQKAMPDRYYDVGIAEQHAILFAAGLALQGAKPVAAIYSTFLQRAFDQIVHDVCLQNLDVVFAMDRAGLVGDDGPTHHGVFDISYLRALPNMVLGAPRDEAELVHLLHTALDHQGPFGLRYPRGAAEGVPLPSKPEVLPIGRGELLREGERVALLGYGYGVPVAIGAADVLAAEHGVEPTVADARFAKPLDTELIASLVAEHDVLVTVEENVLAGGFGSAVLEYLADHDHARRRARAALRPARPLRDPRQAEPAAGRGRPDRRQGGGQGGRGRARAARRSGLTRRIAEASPLGPLVSPASWPAIRGRCAVMRAGSRAVDSARSARRIAPGKGNDPPKRAVSEGGVMRYGSVRGSSRCGVPGCTG